MNSNTNTQARISKSKHTKGPAPPLAGEKKSGLNPLLPFIKPAKDPDDYEETTSTKMRIDDIFSKDTR